MPPECLVANNDTTVLQTIGIYCYMKTFTADMFILIAESY